MIFLVEKVLLLSFPFYFQAALSAIIKSTLHLLVSRLHYFSHDFTTSYWSGHWMPTFWNMLLLYQLRQKLHPCTCKRRGIVCCSWTCKQCMEQPNWVFRKSNVHSFVCVDIRSHQVHLLRLTHSNLHVTVKTSRPSHAAMVMFKCFSWVAWRSGSKASRWGRLAKTMKSAANISNWRGPAPLLCAASAHLWRAGHVECLPAKPDVCFFFI